MRREIIINEVGLRDGLQSQRNILDVGEKKKLIDACIGAGIRNIEAGSFVSEKAIPQMANTDELWGRLDKNGSVNYSALVPNLVGLERASVAGVGEVAVVCAATDTMNKRNIGLDLAKTIEAIAAVVERSTPLGIRCKAYIAVAFECPFEGAVNPKTVLKLGDMLLEKGVDEVVIADTIGAACPEQVKTLVSQGVENWGSDRISCHFHDTRAFGLANTWAALETGVRKFDSSIGGLGGCPFAPGAAGNIATEDVVLMAEQCGISTGINVQALRNAVNMVSDLVGYKVGGRTSAWLESCIETDVVEGA